MIIEVLRYKDTGKETLGLLMINGKHRGYTIEDGERLVKVYGETRIPEGTYKIALRTEGGFNDKYLKKFPSFHKGMLQILDVKNFKFVLIHIGNSKLDTAGCLLVGSNPSENQKKIVKSTDKYKEIYPEIAQAVLDCEPVTINYKKIYE